MRHLFAGLAAVLVLGVVVWALLPRPVGVELADVALRTIEVVVEEEGEARIREVFTVSATVAGTLQRIILHAGDPVVAEDPWNAASLQLSPAFSRPSSVCKLCAPHLSKRIRFIQVPTMRSHQTQI